MFQCEDNYNKQYCSNSRVVHKHLNTYNHEREAAHPLIIGLNSVMTTSDDLGGAYKDAVLLTVKRFGGASLEAALSNETLSRVDPSQVENMFDEACNLHARRQSAASDKSKNTNMSVGE